MPLEPHHWDAKYGAERLAAWKRRRLRALNDEMADEILIGLCAGRATASDVPVWRRGNKRSTRGVPRLRSWDLFIVTILNLMDRDARMRQMVDRSLGESFVEAAAARALRERREREKWLSTWRPHWERQVWISPTRLVDDLFGRARGNPHRRTARLPRWVLQLYRANPWTLRPWTLAPMLLTFPLGAATTSIASRPDDDSVRTPSPCAADPARPQTRASGGSQLTVRQHADSGAEEGVHA